MIQAVLFDMDGVLVDTERQMCLAAMCMFKELGVTVQPDDFLPFVGTGENRYLGGVAEKYGIELDIEAAKFRAYTIYGEIVQGQLAPLHGVCEFINSCRANGIKTVVATSADYMKMEINLREIGIPVDTFDATVNGLEVVLKKPSPEIFLTAARKIEVEPQHCLVVEDAINGVKAAKAAGMYCLALTTSFNPEQLKQADWIFKDLSEVPLLFENGNYKKNYPHFFMTIRQDNGWASEDESL